MTIINETLHQLTIGNPVDHLNLRMYPLVGRLGDGPFYLTLEEALATGCARVTEISEQGSVPELAFENNLDKPVLLLDGEELIGAKQNRMLNLTVLVPANSRIKIPVSCVESGRWSSTSSSFKAADRAQYAGVRASKLAHVSESMLTEGSRRSNQSAVWASIATKMDSMGVNSSTQCASELFERHKGNIEDYVAAIHHTPQQCGAAFAINGRIIGLDIFDNPVTTSHMLPKLIRSYAMDALGVYHHNEQLSIDIDSFMSDVGNANFDAFDAVGMGRDLRLKGRYSEGAALCVKDQIVHLCAFATAFEEQPLARRNTWVRPASLRRRNFH
jgi:hypothetical protein